MVEVNKIYELIISKMKCYPSTIVGITDISYSYYSKQYKCALVLAVPHREIISLNNYSEEKFEKTISATRKELNEIISDLVTILQKYNINYYVPPVAQTNEESLIAPFSFKYSAVNAGIGWIGKNGVLVTKEYGPRIRLSAILIDYDLPIGIPITKSMCDDQCFLCIEACPHKALKGIQWDIYKLREQLIDYQLCNFKRSLFLKKHDRKDACGFCIVACPLGLRV
ncbi:epoxyqueuosine reductase [Clostridium estertheticum]|uniref:Epoxyqueuosine reductase n=1 Tax=Clostridium estertheticum TaxID=238834 RepID=A0AA47EIW6_9CLOT|nr:epoxyqueuosine reductase [Clostridium estertheticum]WAG61032.1 epoxyqueuosine reductase [Clostridium estertheticum]WAG64808.1 epoxyqueuosine reductase [Clostridium estertheticum]